MIAISQPTFFPWIGYFDIIDQVELFIILDDVDFSKQSWQQRNRFKTSSDLEWFTVPVKNLSNKKINEVEILNHERLLKKFKSFIQTNYSKSNYYNLYSEEIIYIFYQALAKNNLAVLNTPHIWLPLVGLALLALLPTLYRQIRPTGKKDQPHDPS